MLGVTDLKGFIEQRMSEAPSPRYAYPLGYPTWTSEEVLAALECLCEQRTTMWTKVAEFEKQFAAYLGATESVMVNSGSSADLIIMLAARELGILKPGDEVLIPAVTWPTQAWAALEAGFNVKLVDVDVHTLNTSPEILEAAITEKTKAIFLVHLMGNPCDLYPIRMLAEKRGLLLFEDCCEALGASYDNQKVGTFGVASAFSFFASHHISTMEGGAIVTSDPEFADACRLMRAHGWARDLQHRPSDVDVFMRYGVVEDPRYLFVGKGFNFRPTELQGAIGQVQLRKLDAMNEWRNLNFSLVLNSMKSWRSDELFEPLKLTSFTNSNPAWFGIPFVLKNGKRKQVTAYLEERGIDSRPIVGGNLAKHPAFWKHGLAGTLPGADTIHDRGFYMGLPPYQTETMDRVIDALNALPEHCA